MRSGDSIAVIEGGDQLGEGPFWDEDRGELLRVDITRGLVHGWDPESGASWRREVRGEVSAAIPRAWGSELVLAVGHRLLLASGEELQELARVEEDQPENRFNDSKCDPHGRLWAGTMSKRRTPGVAALYRLGSEGDLERVVGETTISNGLGWSPAGERMYFIDSTTQRVDAFDFEDSSGTIANRRVFVEIAAEDGLPDGLTVDAEGGVWVCLFGGAAVRRYDADGTLDAVIGLPVTNPTSPVFGGPDLRTLYVTSARHRLTYEQLEAEALAGAVLALEPGVRGLPGNRFRGDLPPAPPQQ
jgi:sugar lactone lactonase YvrE